MRGLSGSAGKDGASVECESSTKEVEPYIRFNGTFSKICGITGVVSGRSCDGTVKPMRIRREYFTSKCNLAVIYEVSLERETPVIEVIWSFVTQRQPAGLNRVAAGSLTRKLDLALLGKNTDAGKTQEKNLTRSHGFNSNRSAHNPPAFPTERQWSRWEIRASYRPPPDSRAQTADPHRRATCRPRWSH